MRHCILALTLLMGAQIAVSDEAPGQDKAQGVLKFNISSGGYPPFTILSADGNVSGIFWDTLSVIAQRLDLTLEPVQIPPKRSDSLLHQGYSDVTMRAIEWTSNPDEFAFSDPVLMTRDAIFVHQDNPRDIRTVEDLQGGTLLTRLGFSYPWLKEHIDSNKVSIIPVQRQQPMFKRLYHGGARFTGAVSNLHAGYWVLSTNPDWDNAIDEAPIRLEEVGLRLMFPPRHAGLVPEINRELARLRQSGELDRIVNDYR
ncbi:substrate-binding periplasmic protein [Marinobacter lacisalsi]|uniref:Substrate-binding periplasmic protein n=1 Tax=Marinobacter lacisalsi TaxID=475979 RepID=A0ABV8QJ24_9GAMM